MAFFILRKLILQSRMHSYPVGLFGRTLHLLPYFMCANSEGYGDTAQMRRVAWAFAGSLCSKYHNLMSWLIFMSNRWFAINISQTKHVFNINFVQELLRKIPPQFYFVKIFRSGGNENLIITFVIFSGLNLALFECQTDFGKWNRLFLVPDKCISFKCLRQDV